MQRLGVKGKVNLGFLVLFLLLLLSGAISVFELTRMRNTMSGVLTKNVNNIVFSRQLLNVVYHIGSGMQELVAGRTEVARAQVLQADSLAALLKDEVQAVEDGQQPSEAMLSIGILLQSLRDDVESAFALSPEARHRMYFDKFLPASRQFLEQTEETVRQNEEALRANAKLIEDSRYRSMVPGIIVVLAGLMLILLFNYFINYLFINPLIKITRAVENTVEYGAPFKVSIEATDEVGELKEAIGHLAQQAKKAVKAEADVKSFNGRKA